MAALTEVSQWEAEIYRIEENDPVQGGESGVDNRPHKLLANRTQFLKQTLEQEIQNRVGEDERIESDRVNQDLALAIAIGNETINRQNADNGKAALDGSNTQRFKVADAVSDDEAVSKSQLNVVANAIPTLPSVATTAVAGIVEKATQAELNAGAANVWPDAATILNGFAQGSDFLKLPEFMGGWKVKWGHTLLGDDTPATAHTTVITGFTEIKTVLVGSTTTDNFGAFIYHRQSFDDNSVTVVFDEWTGQVQTGVGYWWLAIGK